MAAVNKTPGPELKEGCFYHLRRTRTYGNEVVDLWLINDIPTFSNVGIKYASQVEIIFNCKNK